MTDATRLGRYSVLDHNIVLFSAFRYALGRSTYVVDSIVRAIHENWYNFDAGSRSVLVEEILEHKQKHQKIGMQQDEDMWMTIVERASNESVVS